MANVSDFSVSMQVADLRRSKANLCLRRQSPLSSGPSSAWLVGLHREMSGEQAHQSGQQKEQRYQFAFTRRGYGYVPFLVPAKSGSVDDLATVLSQIPSLAWVCFSRAPPLARPQREDESPV